MPVFERRLAFFLFLLLCFPVAFLAWESPSFLRRVDLPFLDLWMRLYPKYDLPRPVVLVGAGEKTLSSLGGSPGSPDVLANLLPLLREARVAVLQTTLPEGMTRSDDETLAASLRKGPKTVLSVRPSGRGDTLLLPRPEVLALVAGIGINRFSADDDGCVRGFLPVFHVGERAVPSLGLAASLVGRGEALRLETRGGEEALLVGRKALPLHRRGTSMLHFGAAIPRYEFLDVLGGRVSPDVFHQATVFVGIDAPFVEPAFPLPAWNEAETASPLRLAAEEFRTIEGGVFFGALSPGERAVLAVVATVCGALLVFALGNRIRALALAVTMLLGASLSLFFFTRANLWIPLTPLLTGLAVGSAFAFLIERRAARLSAYVTLRSAVFLQFIDQVVDAKASEEEQIREALAYFGNAVGVHFLDVTHLWNESAESETLLGSRLLFREKHFALFRNRDEAPTLRLYIRRPARRGEEFIVLGWDREVPPDILRGLASLVFMVLWKGADRQAPPRKRPVAPHLPVQAVDPKPLPPKRRRASNG